MSLNDMGDDFEDGGRPLSDIRHDRFARLQRAESLAANIIHSHGVFACAGRAFSWCRSTVFTGGRPDIPEARCIKADKCFRTKGRNGCGAQQCAAHRLNRLTHKRPAATTNRDSRSGVDVATGARKARRGDGYCARTDGLHPSRALGLNCTEAAFSRRRADLTSHPAAAMGEQE